MLQILCLVSSLVLFFVFCEYHFCHTPNHIISHNIIQPYTHISPPFNVNVLSQKFFVFEKQRNRMTKPSDIQDFLPCDNVLKQVVKDINIDDYHDDI